MKQNPNRIGGFAALPTGEPDKAAKELEQRVREQKFAGAVINGHNRGRYLDDKFYWPILECAEQLGVADLSAPDQAAKAGDRRLVRRLLAAGHRNVLRARLGLAHRNRGTRHTADSRRRLRPLSEPANHHRPSRRGARRHVPPRRHHGAGGDQAETPDRRLSAPQRPLHLLGLQFHPDFPGSVARTRRSTASCSRPTIRISRWRSAGFPVSCRSARRTASASRTATRRSFSSCKASLLLAASSWPGVFRRHAVIASGAKQSRASSSDSGLLRRCAPRNEEDGDRYSRRQTPDLR